MKAPENPNPIDRELDESLRRSFAAPSPAEFEAWCKVEEGSRTDRGWRPRIVVALAAAALLLVFLRIVGSDPPEGDPQLSKVWLARWEEMVTAPSEFRLCTLVDSPVGLLSAARSQLGLHLESDALQTANAPEEREQRLDGQQGVQIVLNDHAYLFFVPQEGLPPSQREFETAGLRITARTFEKFRLYELAGKSAPSIINTLHLVGHDPR